MNRTTVELKTVMNVDAAVIPDNKTLKIIIGINSLPVFINGIEIEHFKCEYVHQYQHLLRLCGLNELANNFKVV